MMDALAEIAAWAWARHHNEWSWYIRPLFLIPYCWFAWRRSAAGLALTLAMLITSMAWFPAPAEPSARAVEILAAERAYLLAPWSLAKLAVALLVPISFAALALAFWRRSLGWGLLVLNAMPITKIAWTFVVFPREGAVYHLLPAAIGLVACNLAVGAGAWRLRRRQAAGHPVRLARPREDRAR